ncbi:toll/interleukin-1 receptor domain-containing protein [Chloroflexota bacterium]
MPPTVFISYSRANRDFAEDLYQKLEKLGFTMYRDLHGLKPGHDFWEQLKKAIDVCDYLVLCLSVDALGSEWVIKEWRYARQEGKRVIPVVAADVFDAIAAGEVKVPRWMGRADWLDFRDKTAEHKLAWDRLTNTLKSPNEALKVPFTVPPSLYDATKFVERPAEYDALKALLLDEDRLNPVAITTALQGGEC